MSPPMTDALTQLKERLGKINDLERVSRVLGWDQQTMMPPAGSEHRADHLATLRRIAHELLIDPETGRLLDELSSREQELDPESDDAALLRLARREQRVRVRGRRRRYVGHVRRGQHRDHARLGEGL